MIGKSSLRTNAMQRSEQIAALAESLAKAQGQYPHLERTRTVKVATKVGGSYTYDYATLADVQACIRQPWSDNGLAYWQTVANVQGGVEITLLVSHSSGQFVETPPLFIPCGQDPQSIGGGITYGLRYQLSAFAGIASEYDDDANGATGHEATVDQRPSSSRPVMPVCPECGKSEGVIVGKPEFGGGFVCFAKKGGCGHKWHGEEKPQTKTPSKSDAELEAAAVLNIVTELAADIRTASTPADVDAVKARCTAAKDRMSGEQSHQLGRLLKAAIERTATPAKPPAATAFNAYKLRIEKTVASVGLMNAIADDIATEVTGGGLTGDEGVELNRMIDAKVATI